MGNSQSIQIEKCDKIRRITHRVAYFGKKANGVAAQHFMRAGETPSMIEMKRFGTFELIVFR